jgi:hypothetical protein
MLSNLKLDGYGEDRIKNSIDNQFHQTFGVEGNVEKLTNIKKVKPSFFDLPFGTKVSTADGRYKDAIIIAKQDTSPRFIGLGWKDAAHNVGSMQVASAPARSSIDIECRSFAPDYDKYTHFQWVYATEELVESKTMKLDDTKLGDTVKFVDSPNVGTYEGLVGTVFAIDGQDRAIGVKSGDIAHRYMVDLSHFRASGRTPKESLPPEQIEQFEKFLWFGPSYTVEPVQQNAQTTPVKQTNMKLKDVPLGSQVRVGASKGTVVGKSHTNGIITLAWKPGEKPDTYSYDVTSAINSLGTTYETIQALSDYTQGYNYSGSLDAVIVPPLQSLKDVPLGTKIKWREYTGVVVGKFDVVAAIGWKDGEKYMSGSAVSYASGNGYTYLPDKEKYVKHAWINNNEQVEVLEESEEKMTVQLKDLMIGQEIEHATLGKMIILGNYSGSGEKLLGKKEAFTGSSQSQGKSVGASYTYDAKWDGTGYHTKWVSGNENVNVVGPRLLKFGLKIGDKVEVFRRTGADGLMDAGHTPDGNAEKLIGTVVGANAAGEPNVFFKNAGTLNKKLNTYNSSIIDKTFLDNSSFVKEAAGIANFWLIRTDKAFNKIEQKENNMNETIKDRLPFLDMMKGDATAAAYRVASTQMTKGIKSGILAMMEKKGTGGDKLKAISEMLDTDVGAAVISMILGIALTYVPKISEDPRAQRLAGEFRTESMAIMGNTLMDTAIEHFLPVLTGALNALPQETTVRVAEVPKVETKTNEQLAMEEAVREEAEKHIEKQSQVQKA